MSISIEPTVKSISLYYNGIKFDSLTECKWAVFFDAIGARWNYNFQALRLPDGQGYNPDFMVDSKMYLEVKCMGGDFSKAELLASSQPLPVFLAEGTPDFCFYTVLQQDPLLGLVAYYSLPAFGQAQESAELPHSRPSRYGSLPVPTKVKSAWISDGSLLARGIYASQRFKWFPKQAELLEEIEGLEVRVPLEEARKLRQEVGIHPTALWAFETIEEKRLRAYIRRLGSYLAPSPVLFIPPISESKPRKDQQPKSKKKSKSSAPKKQQSTPSQSTQVASHCAACSAVGFTPEHFVAVTNQLVVSLCPRCYRLHLGGDLKPVGGPTINAEEVIEWARAERKQTCRWCNGSIGMGWLHVQRVSKSVVTTRAHINCEFLTADWENKRKPLPFDAFLGQLRLYFKDTKKKLWWQRVMESAKPQSWWRVGLPPFQQNIPAESRIIQERKADVSNLGNAVCSHCGISMSGEVPWKYVVLKSQFDSPAIPMCPSCYLLFLSGQWIPVPTDAILTISGSVYEKTAYSRCRGDYQCNLCGEAISDRNRRYVRRCIAYSRGILTTMKHVDCELVTVYWKRSEWHSSSSLFAVQKEAFYQKPENQEMRRLVLQYATFTTSPEAVNVQTTIK